MSKAILVFYRKDSVFTAMRDKIKVRSYLKNIRSCLNFILVTLALQFVNKLILRSLALSFEINLRGVLE